MKLFVGILFHSVLPPTRCQTVHHIMCIYFIVYGTVFYVMYVMWNGMELWICSCGEMSGKYNVCLTVEMGQHLLSPECDCIRHIILDSVPV